jgi:rhodanese-related sulfurtransferase
MKKVSYAVSITILVVVFSLIIPVTGYASDDVPRISTEDLKDMLDDPGIAILDTRIVKDWRKTDKKIRGAVRVDPHDVSSWASNYTKDQRIVVYCA